MDILRQIIKNKKLIGKLAKNDFKTKYSGSYFGIFWAFVQPVVTVLIYVCVFGLGFKTEPMNAEIPYVIYLISGIIPWFFFSEALMNGTNCLVEYSYLVKKVVFQISVLPVVKVLAALFVHLFFIVFALIISSVFGVYPSIYLVQLPYYTFCCICLVTAVAYFTSAIVPFFRDFYQLVNIFVQIGMWLLPIMWTENFVPAGLRWILKLNPMYYVVEGYRNCFANKIWFFQNPKLTLYFWISVIILFIIGTKMFKRMRVHFADVL